MTTTRPLLPEPGLLHEPRLIDRAEQPYVAIRRLVSPATLVEVADDLPRLCGWLAERGLKPAGAPFFKYNVIGLTDLLAVEVGIPLLDVQVGVRLQAATTGDERVRAGVRPAGRFACVTHVGSPDGLLDVTAALLDWGSERGLRWDLSQTDRGQTWGLRLELYKTDPTVEPDLNAWETELLVRLAY
jgi:effector-binding domain-containing protein